MDNTLTPLEDFINAGVQKRFQQVFDTTLLFVNTTDRKLNLAKLKQISGKELGYPIASATLTNVGLPSQPHYRATPLLRRGLQANQSSDAVGTYKLGLIPTEVSYEINYITNDFKDVLKFAKLWLMACAGGYLKFTVAYGVGDLDIHIDLDRNIAIPQRDAAPTEAAEYPITAGMRISGYMSQSQLQKEQAVVELDLDAYVKNRGQDDESAKVEENFAFAIHSQWNDRFGASGSKGD